jgi:hypothetical protein
MRARPAISLADSIRQTASMVRWVSVDVMATDHIICATLTQGKMVGLHAFQNKTALQKNENLVARSPLPAGEI